MRSQQYSTCDCNLSGTWEISCTSEKRRIVARTYRLRCHSWESSRINSQIAQHGAFVLFTLSFLSCHYFFSFRKSVSAPRHWKIPKHLTIYDRRPGFPRRASRLTSKTKYLIFSPEHGSGISCSRGRKPLNLVYSIVA